MRWRQTLNEETGKYEMIPVDDAARSMETSARVFDDIKPYVSPIDGSVITGKKSLREHMKKHDVVLMDDFGADHWKNAEKKRNDHYQGVTSKQEKQQRRENINEVINHLQRNQGS